MNILFVSLKDIRNINNHGIYEDLLREFIKKKHHVYIVTPTERRNKEKTHIIKNESCSILKVKTGNIQKVNMIEKGISTVFLEMQFKKAIKEYYKNVKIDLIIYSTPPVTFAKVVRYVKNRDHARSYLLLKDILPDAAVDIGILKKTGVMGIAYKYFRWKERQLYRLSDYIGCMSQANVDYLVEHNPQVSEEKVGICPNTIDVVDKCVVDKQEVCKKYNLPENKLLLLYGGNFGLPQNVDYVMNVMNATKVIHDVHFVMCGSGTEFYKISDYGNRKENDNITVINALPYAEYKELLAVCDAGMLFLDYRFQVPNFPSRLLDYLNYELPVIAATDLHTDVGTTILDGNFGWWCESRNEKDYSDMLYTIVDEWKNSPETFAQRGKNAKIYLEQNFRTEIAYDEIIRRYNSWRKDVE